MRRARRPLDGWQEDAVTLMLSCRDDGQWACYEYCEWVSRQNGKGGILEARALTGFLLLGEQLILWSAHLYKTAVEMFRRVKALIRALGTKVKPHSDDLWYVPAVVFDEETGEPREDTVIVKVSNANDNRGFERLDTGARILFLARSAGGGRGMSGDVNIIDETFDYDRDEHSALLYTLSARPNAQIIYTSSPPLRGDTGEIMYQLRLRGDPTAPRTVDDGEWRQDPSLGYRDWGHAGDLDDIKVDVDDPYVAAAANPAYGIRITLETIQRELRSDRIGYPRERLGIWPARVDSDGGVLDPVLWAAMGDPLSRRSGDVALAVDVTPMRDHASIGVYGLREDGREHMQLVDYRPGTEWLVDRLVELREELDPICIAYDQKNGARALLPELKERGIVRPCDRDEFDQEPRRGDLLELDTAAAVDAVGQFIDGFRAPPLDGPDGQPVPRYAHLPQAPLDAAVRGAVARPVGDAGQIAWGRRASEVDIGPLQVVTEARYGFNLWVDVVTAEPVPGVWII